ncbi:Casein kinase I isoform alpha [Pseudolycoriella hygida]|uniref:Casein kinase I isoform alpha n=1 Tax=Pseudolycoriella hygida TaxID=35572 RepID=A0A9Q0RZM1_9DIPT|nr:Casein kinase I isoform alpha [Pseudolycoriella hygida]
MYVYFIHLNARTILFRTLNHQYDYTFDWTMLKQKQAANAMTQGNADGREEGREKEIKLQATTELK